MTIYVDAMGGDLAPEAPVKGALKALRQYPHLTIILAGKLDEVKPFLGDYEDVKDRLILEEEPEIITNHESPVMGVRKKVNSAPEYLVQFGIMGDAYMRGVMGMENPRIGLVNIGAEAEKGNKLVKETYPLMEKAPYNFIGNVEARDVPLDQADVCVTDGFGGNLILKYTEGLASALMGTIKHELMADTRGKIAGLIAKPAFKRVKKTMSSDEIGGAPLLGVQGAVIKAHGSSNAYAFCSAIGQCVKMIDGNVVKIIEENVTKMLKEQEQDQKQEAEQ